MNCSTGRSSAVLSAIASYRSYRTTEPVSYTHLVRPERKAQELADQEKVDIRLHSIIYELQDEIKRAMTGLLEPTIKETYQGRAEVLETFRIPKVGTIAGCRVTDGLLKRDSEVRLLRDNVVVFKGKVGSLRRFKDDASQRCV